MKALRNDLEKPSQSDTVIDLEVKGMAKVLYKLFRNQFDVLLEERTKQVTSANEQLKLQKERCDLTVAALLESQEHLRLAVQATGLGFYDFDFANGRSFCSPEFLAIYGLLADAQPELDEEMRPKALHPEDRACFLACMRAANDPTGSGILDLEFRILNTNQEIRWLRVLGRTVFSGNSPADRPLRASGVIRDITHKKRNSEARQAGDQRYRDLVETSQDWVWEVDARGTYTYAGPQVQKILGYAPEELIGKQLFDLMPKDEAGKIKGVFASMAARQQPFRSLVNVNRHKDGHLVVLESDGVPVVDERGNLLGYRGMDRDITERIEAEQALRASESKYRELHQGMMDTFASTDMEGHIEEFNPPFLNMLGYGPDEIGKITYQDITPDRWHPIESAIIEKQVFTRGYSDIYEKEYRRKDGTVFPVELRTTLIRDTAGKPVGMWAIVRDISERRRAEELKQQMEEHLLRAEKMEALGTLAGGVAHDLNNVLGIVVGYCEMLLEDVGESSPLKPDLMSIREGGQRAAAIVQDLLTLARKGVQSKSVVNLNGVIAKCQKSPAFEKVLSFNPNVRITADLEDGLLNIMGSPAHLAKTVLNLAANGVEAMPCGGTLTISTCSQSLESPVQGYDTVNAGDYVVLSVADTGEGISDRDMNHIFEPFYTKKVMGKSGTGLGLAVVWGTVKDHNGYIHVQSQLGKGTTFTLYFPVTREESADTGKSVPVSEYIGNGESILVIDDIKEQRTLAARMLARLNYKVQALACGEEAVEYLRAQKADLVVLDMIMDPGMDGLDTYKAIVEIHPKQKAIIVSGFSETERVKEAISLGVSDYVRKPYVQEKLGLAVKRGLSGKPMM